MLLGRAARAQTCFFWGYNTVHKSRGGRLGEAIKEADWAVVPSESGSGHEGREKDSAKSIKELTWRRHI